MDCQNNSHEVPTFGAKQVFNVVFSQNGLPGAYCLKRFSSHEEATVFLDKILKDPKPNINKYFPSLMLSHEISEKNFTISKSWSEILK